MMDKAFFEEEAAQKLRHGNIFDYKNPVITIKTGGRTYGRLSRQAAERGAVMPDIALATAKFVDPYIFVALWNDQNTYSPKLIADCAASAVIEAYRHKIELVAFAPLGGNQGMQYLWAAEQAIFMEETKKTDAGLWFPEHVFVTSAHPDDTG